MTAAFKLDSRMNIEAAIVLHGELANLSPSELGAASIDCSAVNNCGTAAAQVLVSMAKTLSAAGLALDLKFVLDAMRQDLSSLGLAEFLVGGKDV